MELSYEKTLMPFILLSKKRYVGMLYETDPNKGKMKYMGLSLKRRDSCDYLKDTYGGILTILMKENNLKKALEFLDKSLYNLIDGKVSTDKLMITKALRSDYKNPTQIAHKVLADRIGARDPGNKPKPGDRMKFLHIVSNKKKALQGEKIETPEFIIQENLKIDYDFYITNQLMKPLQQLLGLAVEQIMEDQRKTHDIKVYKKELSDLMQEHGHDLEVYMKKREKIASGRIKTLLFDQILTKIYNRNNKLQDIGNFFIKR
jgi:DNA polymerase elongation subunit (family B)